jgi:hypothetical protein
MVGTHRERDGAVEAYWAHNPGVGGSKPLPATSFIHFYPALFKDLILSANHSLVFISNRASSEYFKLKKKKYSEYV